MTKYFMFLLAVAALSPSQSIFSDLISSSYAGKHCDKEECDKGDCEEECEEESDEE